MASQGLVRNVHVHGGARGVCAGFEQPKHTFVLPRLEGEGQLSIGLTGRGLGVVDGLQEFGHGCV